MGWLGRLQVSGDAAADPSTDETVINYTPYLGASADERLPHGSAGASDHTTDEIKRRQVSLAVRYVAAMRGR
jgi:hypothetical protein